MGLWLWYGMYGMYLVLTTTRGQEVPLEKARESPDYRVCRDWRGLGRATVGHSGPQRSTVDLRRWKVVCVWLACHERVFMVQQRVRVHLQSTDYLQATYYIQYENGYYSWPCTRHSST